VPVAHNAGLYWGKNAFLKHPGTITLRIGPAIATQGRDPAQVNAEVERWIETQQEELCPPLSN
jgi:1-acyl-sn-glycerol-3-phosphate acyltransferase